MSLITDPLEHNKGRDKFSYPPIPVDAELFQNGLGYEKPVSVEGWEWSTTFGRWSALVTFEDGWHGFSYPKLSPLYVAEFPRGGQRR